VIGLGKKVVIADYFIANVSEAFADAHGLPFFPAWDGVLSYSLQLYFDFSGYSDMAIGLALLFGLRFPANFNSPYRAASIIDFWQRWHMTLTRYLTLYLYNPLALWVSRRRLAQGKSVSRQAIATPGGFFSMIAIPTFYTMILAGVWHGAGLQFLIFGLLHGAYLTINHAWRSFGPRVPATPPHPFLRFTATVAKVALTYLGVIVAQVFFRAASVHDAIRLLKGMLGVYGIFGHAVAPWSPAFVSPRLALLHGVVLAGLYLVIWTMPNSLQLLDSCKPTLSKILRDSPISFEAKPTLAWGIVLGFVGAVALLEITGMTEFLYFRF